MLPHIIRIAAVRSAIKRRVLYVARIRESIVMKALAFAAFVAITFLAAGTPAQADFRIIQWFYGDCKIWGGGRPPLVGGWRALTPPIR